jgi:hypothetical protein
METNTPDSNTTFSQSEHLAKKKDEYKFFFYGALITIVVTTLIQLIILPIHVQNLQYYYGDQLLISSPLSDIYLAMIFVLIVMALLYFIGYKTIIPWLMRTNYTSQTIISIPLSGSDEIAAFEELKRIVRSVGQMNGLETDIEDPNKFEITGHFPEDIKITVKWDRTGASKVILTWINDTKSIKIAKEVNDEFLSYMRRKMQGPLSQKSVSNTDW